MRTQIWSQDYFAPVHLHLRARESSGSKVLPPGACSTFTSNEILLRVKHLLETALQAAISSSFPPLNHVKYRQVHRKLPDCMPSHKKFCSELFFPSTGTILTWSANQTFRVSKSFSHEAIGNRTKLTGKFYIFHVPISSGAFWQLLSLCFSPISWHHSKQLSIWLNK